MFKRFIPAFTAILQARPDASAGKTLASSALGLRSSAKRASYPPPLHSTALKHLPVCLVRAAGERAASEHGTLSTSVQRAVCAKS